MAALNIENNSEYNKYAGRWSRVRAINNGEARLKESDLQHLNKLNTSTSAIRATFLRPINPTDKSAYNQNRNINYINGARLYNATVKTLSGLLGMLYRKPPTESEVPEALEYIFTNVNGSGLTMNQQSRSVSSDVIQIGRDGLLVDMPRNDEGNQLTQADVDNGFKATIQEYKAESIIDWHESVINNAKILDLLILQEAVEVFTDEMRIQREIKKQFKVYRLSPGGVTIQIFTESTKKGEGLEKTEEIQVMGANNTPLTAIPFTFVGSMNNQPSIDNLPLEPISDINIGHYQESANLASSSFQLSACQPWVASNVFTKTAETKAKNGGSVELGEDSMIIVEAGGSFNYATPPENNMSKGIQKDYEEQMIALGAQLITNGGGVETAEAARIKHSSDVSDLEVISTNISTAYTQCIEWVCLFMGIDYQDYSFELNDEFFDMALSAEDAVKWVSVWQGGAFSKSELDTILVKGKAIGADVNLDEMNTMTQQEQGNTVDFGNDE